MCGLGLPSRPLSKMSSDVSVGEFRTKHKIGSFGNTDHERSLEDGWGRRRTSEGWAPDVLQRREEPAHTGRESSQGRRREAARGAQRITGAEKRERSHEGAASWSGRCPEAALDERCSTPGFGVVRSQAVCSWLRHVISKQPPPLPKSFLIERYYWYRRTLGFVTIRRVSFKELWMQTSTVFFTLDHYAPKLKLYWYLKQYNCKRSLKFKDNEKCNLFYSSKPDTISVTFQFPSHTLVSSLGQLLFGVQG